MSDSIDIPGYRTLRKLGQGGMASVYLAVQESFDREVALKVMSPFLNSDPSFATRFLREARIVAQIHHSSIVPVMDVGQAGGHHYLSMEYLPGGDLKQRIVEGRHGPNLALNVCVAISSALDLAHRKGFVHRDIKPENILFREDGTPVLTDFGIARAIDAGTQLTMAGTMVGTPSYMSPEQVKGAELDGRSDLYSLGVVFYEMLTGLVPFRADSTMTLAMKHLTEPLPLLPPQFAIYQPFVDRLMAKDREDRFATGAEVIRALRLITDMAIAREQTIMRNRPGDIQVGQGGGDMTLVSPNTGSMNLPPAAAEPGSIRIPSTATQPSGIMQIPSLAARTSGIHSAPLANSPVPAGTEQLATPESSLVQPTLVAPLHADNLDDATRPRPPSQQTTAAPTQARPQPLSAAKPPAKPAQRPRVPGVPLQVRARALLQTFIGSKHATWIAVGAVALLAIGTGYLLGRSSETAAPPVAQAAAPPVTEQTKVAVLAPPPQAAPPAEDITELVNSEPIAGTPVDTDLTPSSPDPAPAVSPESPDADAGKRAAAEEARRKKNEEIARLKAERIAAANKLREEQIAQTAQAARDREARIKQLLAQAKVDIAQGRLVSPQYNNAADRYREIISKEKEAPAEAQEARAGMKRIAEILVAEAYRSLANSNKEGASQFIANVESVQPDHPELAKLRSRVQAIGGESGKPLSKSQQASLARTLEKLDKILSREPQSLDSIEDALREYGNAQRISNVASGMSIYRARIEEAFVPAVRYEMGKGNTKQAQRIIAIARVREWMTPDLQQLEQTLDATQSP